MGRASVSDLVKDVSRRFTSEAGEATRCGAGDEAGDGMMTEGAASEDGRRRGGAHLFAPSQTANRGRRGRDGDTVAASGGGRDHTVQPSGLLGRFKKDISAIKGNFAKIEAFLKDAENKGLNFKDAGDWIKRVRRATLMVENMLDDVSSEAKLQKERGIRYRVRGFLSSDHNQLLFRFRLAKKLKSIREEFHAIASQTSTLDLVHDEVGHGVRETKSHNKPSSDNIFVRKEEMEMVIKKICNKDVVNYDGSGIRVYGIWGMGGVGKTTLVRLVYNHTRVKSYFNCRCWIQVSKNLQIKDILTKILTEISTLGTHPTELQMSFQKNLRGKFFLIVLDGIGDVEKSKWKLLKDMLSCGAVGSVVLITTRSQTTCKMLAKDPELQLNLGCLSEEESWLLFKRFAFAHERAGDEPGPIRKLVEKCGGLPLALKILGRLMKDERKILGRLMKDESSTSDWHHVQNNVWESLKQQVMTSLMLSYNNLLPHEKTCFAYCCLFPKGYVMVGNVVIQLWVVNGFIPPRAGETNLYKLGKEIIDCLVSRSLFQVVKDKNNLNIRFKMHYLIHDMAQYVLGDECLIIERGKEARIANEALHLSSSQPDFEFSSEDTKLLRSVFMFREAHDKGDISKIFNHEYLRVLYLCGIELSRLSDSICKLKYLKYLNLSYTSIEVLPESIIYLENLEVLLLNFCYALRELPKKLNHMSRLQNLAVSSCDSLMHFPSGIKELTNLKRLSRFPVGNKIGAEIGELGDLHCLEGELEISGLENVDGLKEAEMAKLKNRENLSVVKLSWSNKYMREMKRKMLTYDDSDVLKGLEPNQNLEELRISFYMGNIISPSWMSSLKNLTKIGLFGCKECQHIQNLGQLPKLRVIKLLGMDSFKSFQEDKDTPMFISLEKLYIFMCPNLGSLPSNLPKLEILKLEQCGALTSLPAEIFKGLKEFEISGCKHLSKRCEKEKGEDWHIISHIPNIKIDSPSYI